MASLSCVFPTTFAWKGSSNWISRKGHATRSSISLSWKGAAVRSSSIGIVASHKCSDLSHGVSEVSPWLLLPPAFEGADMVYNFYSLAQDQVLSFNKRGEESESDQLPDDDADLVGASHGWLAFLNNSNHNLFLSNPLSRRHIKLPDVHTLPHIRKKPYVNDISISKVIISCSPDEEECRAMMIYGGTHRLAFCCPGRSTEWTPIGDMYIQDSKVPTLRHKRFYMDVAYSNKHKLFACITDYDLEHWGLGVGDPPSCGVNSMKLVEDFQFYFEKPRPWADFLDQLDYLDQLEGLYRDMSYLVLAEQSNKLFLVFRHLFRRKIYVKHMKNLPVRDWDDNYPYKTLGFDVFEVDREGGSLNYLEGSLHGLAMFLGSNHSFALSALEFPELGLKPNSIYFTDVRELTPPDWHAYGSHDIGVYNFENRTFSPCYYPNCGVQTIKGINVPAPVWFTPSLH